MRERQSMQEGQIERKREGDKESETGSRLWVVSTKNDSGLELRNSEIMTWAEVGCPTNWATQAPIFSPQWTNFFHMKLVRRKLDFVIFKKFLMVIYFWQRERHSMSRGQAEREGDTESKVGSSLWAVSTEPDAELELADHEIMTWAKVRRSTN